MRDNKDLFKSDKKALFEKWLKAQEEPEDDGIEKEALKDIIKGIKGMVGKNKKPIAARIEIMAEKK